MDFISQMVGAIREGRTSLTEDQFYHMIYDLPVNEEALTKLTAEIYECPIKCKNKILPFPEPNTCVCAGHIYDGKIKPEHYISIVDLASKWYDLKPWLLLRMNHVLRVEVEGSPYKFVQVIGGGGSCEIGIIISKT